MKKRSLFVALFFSLAVCAGALAADVQPVSTQIPEADAALYFPGYTLRSYGTYSPASEVGCSYSRVEDGVLYVKHVTFYPGRPEPDVTDCMPVPLSPALLERLEKEDFHNLLHVQPQTELFQLADAFDTARIPVEDRVLTSLLQEHALLLITADQNGMRRLNIVTLEDGEYRVSISPILPVDAELNHYNTAIEWNAHHAYVFFSRLADGTWFVTHASEPYFDYSPYYFGVLRNGSQYDLNDVIFGAFAYGNILEADLNTLPLTEADLYAAINRDGWAVVNGEDGQPLPLLEAPDAAAESAGAFLSGTPAQVLEERNGWCKVRIGLDERFIGWMQKDSLAFGSAMDEVNCSFLQKALHEEYRYRSFYASCSLTDERQLDGSFWIVGMAGDDAYLLLTPAGETAYAPRSWFWDGNG